MKKVALAIMFTSLGMTIASSLAAQESGDNTGTNPINFTYDWRAYFEMQSLTGGDNSLSIITIEHKIPVSQQAQFRFRVRHNSLSLDPNEDGASTETSGLGDWDARLLYVPKVSSKGAIAVGLEEVVDTSYLAHRIEQVAYLGEGMRRGGVPVLTPFGGHAIYVDAAGFLPHIPRDRFPGQALAVALYMEAGIRTVEIGGVMFGKTDPESGKTIFPKLELVRFAVPRRVYMREHLDFVIDSVADLYQKRDEIHGYEFEYQADVLRHFTARFRPVAPVPLG